MPPTWSCVSGATLATGPEVGPHPGQEFLERERLHQVVVRPEVEAFDPVGHPCPGAQHEDGNITPALPQSLEHLKAVQVGQAEIEYHE